MSTTTTQHVSCVAIPPQSETIPSPSIHLLPFAIDYDGEAKVETFFHPEQVIEYKSAASTKAIEPKPEPIAMKSDQLWTAHFRGREMTGRVITFNPDTTVGLTITPIQHPAADDEDSDDNNDAFLSITSQHSQLSQSRFPIGGARGRNNNNRQQQQETADRERQSKEDAKTLTFPPTAQVSGTFDHVTVWRRDHDISVNDYRTRVLEDFITISNAFHLDPDDANE